MIRQAISCDICGTEKKQTNHWFVAQDRGAELRLSGWNSRGRSSAGVKHLCGQTCLHKLVDEFMARTIASRPAPAAVEALEAEARTDTTERAVAMDTSLTAAAAYPQLGPRVIASSAAVVTLLGPAGAIPVAVVQAATAQAGAEIRMEPAVVPLADEPPGYGTRSWRAEAWEREREREMRSAGRKRFSS